MKPEGKIRVEIINDSKDPGKSLIKTNIRKEMVPGILEEWVCSQLEKGEDKKKIKEKDVYEIIIELDLKDDTFCTTSNTGNADLTAGIILSIMRRLNENKIKIVKL